MSFLMDWQVIYRDLTKRNWVILFLLSATSFFFLGDRLTLGIIMGGFVSIVNFNLLQNTIRKAFPCSDGVNKRKPVLIAKYYLRLLGLGVAIYLLLKTGRIDAVGLAVGLSTVVMSIVSFGITSALRISTGEAG
ncbi:MAG: ATP synthase subunit I [Deltaproteobacteria bacterium]|nr:ATP synthase subunit I [Deltaproteobacteria bacterium]